jgi:hypothetical protein
MVSSRQQHAEPKSERNQSSVLTQNTKKKIVINKMQTDSRSLSSSDLCLQTELAILSEEKRNAITSIFGSMKHGYMDKIRQLEEENLRLKSNAGLNNASLEDGTSSSKRSLTLEESPLEEPSPSNNNNMIKKHRGGSDNLDAFRDPIVNGVKGMERLNILLSVRRHCKNNSNLTESARSFVNVAVNPVLKCLETHHDNDKEKFLEKWPLAERSYSTFKKKCCNCKGAECGIGE